MARAFYIFCSHEYVCVRLCVATIASRSVLLVYRLFAFHSRRATAPHIYTQRPFLSQMYITSGIGKGDRWQQVEVPAYMIDKHCMATTLRISYTIRSCLDVACVYPPTRNKQVIRMNTNGRRSKRRRKKLLR